MSVNESLKNLLVLKDKIEIQHLEFIKAFRCFIDTIEKNTVNYK